MDIQLKVITLLCSFLLLCLWIWIFLGHIQRGLSRIHKQINDLIERWEELWKD